MNLSSGLMRSHNCGELKKEQVGESVTLCGWVNKYRNLGKLHFIDLRDKYGITQLSFDSFKEDIAILKKCCLESVIKISGVVGARPDDAINSNMNTGSIEVQVTSLEILSASDIDNIPFLPCGVIEATEDLRLKYRYLDLRSPHLQKILKLRSQTTSTIRSILQEENFVEVETPILYKTTPEGARDYIVPSRVHPGKVYALPQSPQTLKQLLMIGGMDKYFQICRCFRDEDLRADRQPEFTQVDIEASFVTPEFIKKILEKILGKLFNMPADFTMPTMSYQEAMELYGSDKPDLRFDLKHMNVTDLFSQSEFKTFAEIQSSQGLIKALFVPAKNGNLSRKEIDSLVEVVKPHGGKGVAFFKINEGKASGGISRFVTPEILSSLQKLSSTQEDGLWLFCADQKHSVSHSSADALRNHLGRKLDLIEEGYNFLWVNDFPLLEWSEKNSRFVAKHHPFTMPKTTHIENFLRGQHEDLLNCIADAYDVVCNGHEIAGGSIRIHRQDIQNKMFKALGMSEEETNHQFGFFIEALKYGTPPHGGCAMGLDRVIMLLAKTDSIRDVIAFPKTNSATDLMSNAPSFPTEEQLKELHLKLKN